MRKTAMVQLRDKLLEEIEDKRERAKTDKYALCYSRALQNIANDIGDLWLAIEKDTIVDSFAAGFGVEGRLFTAVSKGQSFYDELFGEVK